MGIDSGFNRDVGRSLTGAWIETIIPAFSLKGKCRSLTGAWIETDGRR